MCSPTIAANAFAEKHPEAAAGMTSAPAKRRTSARDGPPLAGSYYVLRYQAPVAVCTLNSGELAGELRTLSPSRLSIVGTMHTENLGIERLIRNVAANLNLRFLVLCGQ
ncbi:MAG: tetrahydromethanopterin S-methyltransferase subunit A, partial [Acidobacteria bacterium]|nr:tetrahydromethanopterin S-methyltransferase subunit A [Acidobacteriota bacterium]